MNSFVTVSVSPAPPEKTNEIVTEPPTGILLGLTDIPMEVATANGAKETTKATIASAARTLAALFIEDSRL